MHKYRYLGNTQILVLGNYTQIQVPGELYTHTGTWGIHKYRYLGNKHKYWYLGIIHNYRYLGNTQIQVPGE